MNITLEGFNEVEEKLNSLLSEEELIKAMGKACAIVERAAKQKAPKGNGELRRSITSKVQGIGQDVEGVVYTPLEYAPYVEFGTGLFAEDGGRTDVPWCYQDDEGEWHSTSGQKPQPFMRPALYDNVEQIKQTLKGGLVND